MRLERCTLATAEGAGALAAELRGLVPGGESVAEAVATILDEIRFEGDAAVERWRTEQDAGGVTPQPLRVEPQALADALAALDPDVRAGLDVAIANVRAVAEGGLDAEREVILPQGHGVLLREIPVARAAVYVPGGRAPYPSTVVMGVVTAQVAGVEEVVVCAPPTCDGDIHPTILATCALLGVVEVYRMGGAHGIAALAYGSETVVPVDVIVGPGGLYVQEAKRQVADHVGIDGFAGPSDLLVILDGDAPTALAASEPEGADGAVALAARTPLSVRLAALDLRAQGEHGADSLVVAVSHEEALLDALAAELADAPEPAPVALVQAHDLDVALALANAFAPEHLELIGPGAEALAPQIRNAGCLFVGAGAATAFGDYVAGSNHVLPTDGAARFASGLSARTFRRRMAEVRITDEAATALAPHGAAIARAESFESHATSMEARIRENGEQ